MGFQTMLCLIFVFLVLLVSSSQGYKFYVGGRDGWVIQPSDTYDHWARHHRFQVNDTLFFKFKKGEDSVLLVTRENFNTCNVNNPIKSLTETDSEYKFERSGPHYFISGNADHCSKGQKLIVVVLAVRPKTPAVPAPAALTPPTGTAPVLPPPTPAPTPLAQTSALASPAQSPEDTPAPSSLSAYSPSANDKKTSAAVFGYDVPNVVLSVAIGIGVFLVSFGGRV